eukprot:gene17848-biopygen7056
MAFAGLFNVHGVLCTPPGLFKDSIHLAGATTGSEHIHTTPTQCPIRQPRPARRTAVPTPAAQVGKWHVGYATRAHIPTGRGFISSFGYFHAYNGYLSPPLARERGGQWAAGQYGGAPGTPGKDMCPDFPGAVKYGNGSLYGERGG